ncbi:hypothetical protein [Nocardioides jejuensis]|uniref:DUF3168 domain-containing protein n=1 Tax=Nocardioides jejuensis TaxID=2502782 RepID=A0A4R1BY89_9ACTN|nr:hypothetical protein [Nocardioides jejuensis]TCJ23023.1 hypothetical protein EPD65_11720 [Nocardioides jejuensis]
MAQSIKATVAGLKAACDAIYSGQIAPDGSPVLVTYGPPDTYMPAAMVAVGMDIRQPITRPTMGSARSRDKQAEIDVVINVWTGSGTEEGQPLVSEKADDLAELLEAYFRASGQETLGGGCMDSWVSNITGPKPDVTFDENGAIAGRVAESIVTVTARIRQ